MRYAMILVQMGQTGIAIYMSSLEMAVTVQMTMATYR
jgi:hypothetical protein